MKKPVPSTAEAARYSAVFEEVSQIVEAARRSAARSVNAVMTAAYWLIGRHVVEDRRGQKRQTASAESLLDTIRSLFPLPWSAYVRLLSVRNERARAFYEAEALRGGWTVRQLDRQINTQFYERTALSREKAALLAQGGKMDPGDRVLPEEEIKDPFVLEFLDLKDAAAGQMHLYLNYAREHWVRPEENPPVGLILCAQKDEAVARYALDGLPKRSWRPSIGPRCRTKSCSLQKSNARGRCSSRVPHSTFQMPLRIPMHSDHRFRPIPITDSDGIPIGDSDSPRSPLGGSGRAGEAMNDPLVHVKNAPEAVVPTRGRASHTTAKWRVR